MPEKTFSIKVPDEYYDDDVERWCEIKVPIPLPLYWTVEDYASAMCAREHGNLLNYAEVVEKIRKFIYVERVKLNRERSKKPKVPRKSPLALLIHGSFPKSEAALRHVWMTHSRDPVEKEPKEMEKQFYQKFLFVVNNSSSENLLTLMNLEIFMKRKMTELIRARNWEVDQLTKQCEKLMAEEQGTNMHPHRISHLNEKLRSVYTTYSHQVAQTAETQRLQYKFVCSVDGGGSKTEFCRQAVDSLYTKGSIPAFIVEEMEMEEKDKPLNLQVQEDTIGKALNESYTIYIGAQLKSMHNACLITADTLTDICQTRENDWRVSSRLEMATKLYGRCLGALVLLVPRDPLFHTNSSSKFAKICEESTEMHVKALHEQLVDISNAAKRMNMRKADELEMLMAAAEAGESLEGDPGFAALELESARKAVTPETISSMRQETCFSLGEIYITRHSNLHQVQVVFHLVTDESLQTSEIASRHACLSALRNIIRMTANYHVSSVYLPLLLIDQPSESTTVAWCVKRAEMVYKCVKGYLMEVCTGPIESLPHYNIHFVLPAGLAPVVYATISAMFPTIFHLVPSVSITI